MEDNYKRLSNTLSGFNKIVYNFLKKNDLDPDYIKKLSKKEYDNIKRNGTNYQKPTVVGYFKYLVEKGQRGKTLIALAYVLISYFIVIVVERFLFGDVYEGGLNKRIMASTTDEREKWIKESDAVYFLITVILSPLIHSVLSYIANRTEIHDRHDFLKGTVGYLDQVKKYIKMHKQDGANVSSFQMFNMIFSTIMYGNDLNATKYLRFAKKAPAESAFKVIMITWIMDVITSTIMFAVRYKMEGPDFAGLGDRLED